MSQNIADNGSNQPSLEMAVPYRRMKGWAIVPWTEDSERSTTSEQNILPQGQKRVRSQTKRFGIETDVGQNGTKRQAMQLSEDKREKIKPSAKIRVGVRARSKDYNQLEREVQRLKMENALLAVAESQEIQGLKSEVKRLEDLKVEQNKKFDRLIARTLNPASPSYTNNLDDTETIKMKEKEIEQQNATIRDLQSSLRSALKLNMLLTDLRDEDSLTANVDFAYEMKDLELRVLRTAEFLANCLYPLDKLMFTIQIHPDLGDMIREATGSVRTFSSMPGQGLRALLFQFICNQIIYSNIWTALHVEGYMLRAYQETIQRGATSEFFENFHKAALLHMLGHDSEFKTCFLESHVEELQAHITALLDPLLNPSELERQEVNFHRELRDLLSTALSFRSRCFPVGGERYEVIQFQPGERFDPTMMEAQLATGDPAFIPKDKQGTIKLCVHGLIVAHAMQENSTGLQKVKQLSQPFQTSKSENVRKVASGKIITGKAIVILQD